MQHGRHALSLIELVVVLAIIALLLALLVPAIQMAREASRRATCGSHLRQIGVAIQAYHADYNVLPPGSIRKSRFSAQCMLLPYLGQSSVYNAINFAEGEPQGRRNTTAHSSEIAVFLCPSDPNPGPGDKFAKLNYAANTGTDASGRQSNGPFSNRGAVVRFGDITDGTSTTIAFSEWIKGSRTLAEARLNRLGPVFDTPAVQDFDLFLSTCRELDTALARIAMPSKGLQWIRGEMGFSNYNHLLGINENSCLNDGAVQTGAYSAGSFHRHGANVLFVDGHVRFVNAAIDLGLWRSLATRNGGEAIDSAY